MSTFVARFQMGSNWITSVAFGAALTLVTWRPSRISLTRDGEKQENTIKQKRIVPKGILTMATTL
jgi:hypothetical protein